MERTQVLKLSIFFSIYTVNIDPQTPFRFIT